MSEQIILAPPPVETLLSGDFRLWPDSVKHSAELKKQAETRLRLCSILDTVFKRVPNPLIKLTDAIDAEIIPLVEATQLYEKLGDFLREDPCNARLILYLPFEVLPHFIWRHMLGLSGDTIARFITAYTLCWRDLLSFSDVRANFVDGDVPEPDFESAPPLRVVKAAHLIPVLLEKHYISINQIFDLMQDHRGSVLEKSIIETLPVLGDMKLIPMSWIKKIFEARNIPMHTMRNTDPLTAISPARAQWLKKEEERKLVEKETRDIAYEISCGFLAPVRLEEMEHEGITTLAIIHGIRSAVESVARSNKNDALRIYLGYERILLDLWKKKIPEITDAIISTWSRLLHLQVIEQNYLEKLGAILPRLDVSFTERKKSIEEEITGFETVIEHIGSDPRLARLFYPVCILFGSRVKGYGTSTADLDVAVFIKPEISFKERPEIQKILAELFSHEKVKGKVFEFWLEKNNDNLEIKDFSNPDVSLGDSLCAHVLFGGAWYGKEETIRELYEKLLCGYFYSHYSRKLLLEEMERDSLRYRLMHKGYARLFPEQGGIHTEHAANIDTHSMFYDSGYRRLATKLFITKVFLPNLL